MRLLALFLAGCSGCQPTPSPAPVPPVPVPVVADAAPRPAPPKPVADAAPPVDACQEACANEARLGCVQSAAACTKTCRKIVASNLVVLPLSCLATMKACDEALCNRK